MRLVKKIKNRLQPENSETQNENSDQIEGVEKTFLERQGYFRFGNFLISNILQDFVFLVEEYCMELEKAIQEIQPEIIMLYLKVHSVNIRSDMDSDLCRPLFYLLWVYMAGDSLLSDYDENLIIGKNILISKVL